MPAYNTKPAIAIYPGDGQAVWSAESPATSSASQQVALYAGQTGDPQACSVELKFSGDPGTFSVTVQTADTDADAAYTTYAGASPIIAVNSGFYASLQLVDLRCNFVRLFMTDDPSNSVTTTASITR